MTIQVGDGSPWGRVERVNVMGDIFAVSTTSHGGFWVPPEVLDRVPVTHQYATFRQQGLRGWFEEDCDWSWLVFSFPESFTGEEREVALRIVDHMLAKGGAR